MRTAFLISAVFLALASTIRAQVPADAGWTARLAALEEERAAQTGVAVSIVFDDSGSMFEHNKMPMAKQAFHAWVTDAPANYRFGLDALNAGRLVEMKPDNKQEILAAVDRLAPKGDTPLADTIARVGQEIARRRAAGAVYERQVMVVLTDGEDNTRRGSAGVQQEIKQLRARQVEVIAFGYQGEGQYMRDSATHFFSPDNAADIRRGLNVIAAEIGDTSDVIVDDATRARMENAAAAPSPSPSLPAASPARTAQPAPNGGNWTRTILICLVIGFLLFRRGNRR